MRRSNDIRTRFVNGRMNRKARPVDGSGTRKNISRMVHEHEIRYPDKAKPTTEGSHPKSVGELRVACGDVAGRP